jgi:tetratricopeptide (TPR) repeat protein
MKCPNCQAENSDKAKFCILCGTPLHEEIECPQCHHINKTAAKFCEECGKPLAPVSASPAPAPTTPMPTSFVNGRYKVKKFLGEGGKKKVYLAHDTVLDRDVAFALIKTEKLDAANRARITREAQAMGRLGDHPNIVSIYEMGEEKGQPYIVIPFMPGGDVEGLIEKAPEHRLPIDKAIEITKSVCKGLEFAHSKGIIHRDIKPGNVWLSADGTAKVGDFGLALSIDLSRLTHEGMMVGTYYYMPPEQAMGGEITPRADLYSLGAMLYEMVTGRPPFTGDDTVAIIGQHINTPPVSPNWHRPELSPALAALIMRLLEKDPQKRPASATEVLKALEAIEAGKAEKLSSQQTEALAENPLYRRVFVGREAELRQLQSAFDTAASGQGSLTMVVGEPGIGKTALTEQLATYVSLRGGKSLVGHCYEEGSLSLPYLAFVEALRTYAQSRDVSELRKELGTGAADVARIVSEVKERLKIQPKPKENPEEERYRLMQAITDFLGNVAKAQPLLIVLEDLHSADRDTLEMLEHVARNLTDKRLLLVGTYRDVEVDRTHPLSAALAELRRLPSFGRVLLRGLNADEVRRMLSSITGQDVPWGLAETVHRQTEGNPLFVQEVVRYLVEEGVFTRDKGRWQAKGDTPVEMRIPDGLRDVIGKRLSSLSESCNKVLSIAAVIGRDFRLEVLQKVAGMIDEEIFKALEEARKAAVVEERTGAGATVNYRFAHAFFRQTLYEEIIAPRRIRLHQQVARALEEVYKNRLEEHAAELAEHFSYSSNEDDLKKAVSYGEMAAKRAMDVYAYGEAVRLLDQALKVQEILDPEDKAKRCNLILALGKALSDAGEHRRVLDVAAPEALALAQEIGDVTRASQSCRLAITGFSFQGAGAMWSWASPEAARWAEWSDKYAAPDTEDRVWADLLLGLVKISKWQVADGQALLSRALSLAKRLGNPSLLWSIANILPRYRGGIQYADERTYIVNELLRQPRTGVDVTSLRSGLTLVLQVFLESGQRERAQETFHECQNIAERTKISYSIIFMLFCQAVLYLFDGDLDKVAETIRNMTSRSQELGISDYAAGFSGFVNLRLGVYRGGRGLELWEQGSRTVSNLLGGMYRHFVLAHLGRYTEAKKAIEQAFLYGSRSYLYEVDLWPAVLTLEASVITEDRELTEFIFNAIVNSTVQTTGLFYPTCIPRHFGGACSLLGRYDEARKYYDEAIRVCTEMRFRPELALSRLQLAELLLEHYPKEKKKAVEHLDFAIKEFREMKMQPSLERSLRHKEILKA